jgi:hypothetical protein
MPLYEYRTADGKIVERNVPVAQRDEQEGLERILTFTGSVWAPTSGGMK